jgi:hypothetical protein
MGKLQDILKQTSEQIAKDKISINELNSSNISFDSIANALPSDLKQSSQDKINSLVLSKVNDLKSQVEDKLNTTLSQLQSSDVCPTEATLNTILGVRDGILTQIDNTVNTLNRTKKGLDSLKNLTDAQLQAIETTSNIKTAAQLTKSAGIITQGLLPTVPGAVASAIDIADTTIQVSDDIIKALQFDIEGKTKIPALKTQISTGLFYVNLSSQSLSPLIDKLKSIDSILEKCGKKPSSIPQNVVAFVSIPNAVAQNNTLVDYQGFILDIIEKPFGNNLTQKIGVAKNTQGVVLLQTSPSFTTNPSTLISELKFLIDKNNLKAN